MISYDRLMSGHLQMHYPAPRGHRSRSRRRRQWWKAFASPRWLLAAAPALLLPLLAMFVFDDDPSPSPVEQAVLAMPVAGYAQMEDAGATPLGRRGAGLPSAMALPLFAGSARAEALRLSMRRDTLDDSVVQAMDRDIRSRQHALLHSRPQGREDHMMPQFQLLFATPAALEVMASILKDYCAARPGDVAFYVDATELPLPGPTIDALAGTMVTTDMAASCPRLLEP
jgi:hypothetical protein